MRGLFIAAVSLCAMAQAGAEEAGLTRQVRQLIRQLDSLRLSERDDAEAALLELGPPILDLLPPITDRTPPDVAQRLGRVRQKLQRTAAAAIAEPARVTLHARAMPLSQVFASLQEQTGNRMLDARARFGHKVVDPELAVEFQDTPFWEALDSVLDQAGLTVYPYGEQRAIYIVARPEGQASRRARAQYVGPLRIEPILVRTERDLRSTTAPLLQITNEIAWEPRVRPVLFEQPMSAVRAQASSGEALVLDAPKATPEIPVEGERIAANLIYAFRAPPREVDSIALFEASLRGVLPGKVATFRFDAPADTRGASQRIGGATVTLEQVRRSGEFWEIAVRVRFDDAGPALQSHRGWIFKNPAFLQAKDGTRTDYDHFETTRQTENEIGLSYLFDVAGPIDAFSFVYQTPALLLDVTLPYTLKDIPLP